MRMKKGVKIVLSAAFTAILCVGMTITILAINNPSIKVKNFVGQSKKVVETWRKENKLDEKQVVYTYAYSEETKENNVLEQSLKEGEVLSDNDVLKVTLSHGPDPDKEFALANFEGKTKEEIAQWFTQYNFTNVSYTYEENADIQENTYISMDPAVGTIVKRSDAITIKISGIDPEVKITAPDLSNYSKENLEAWAKENEITINYEEVYSDSVENGAIVSISIEDGATLKKGDTITVSISKGPQPEEEKQKDMQNTKQAGSSSANTQVSSAPSNSSNNASSSSSTGVSGSNEGNSTNVPVVKPTVEDKPLPALNTSFYNGLSASDICAFVQEDTGYPAVAAAINGDASSNPNNYAGLVSYYTSNGTYYLTIAQKWS